MAFSTRSTRNDEGENAATMTENASTTLGFTSHGRPINLAGRILSAEITFDDGTTLSAESDLSRNATDLYTLVGADHATIAENLKSYTFAVSAALRWSRMLGQPVTILRRYNADDVDPSLGYLLHEEEVVAAHEISDEEFAATYLLAERARLENAIASLREIEMDVRAMREDATSALDGIKALSSIDDMPDMPVAEVARAAAETYETLEWFVLVAGDDANMLAELTAR